MDIGAVTHTPISPIASAQANGTAIASAQGHNTTRVEAALQARTGNDAQNNAHQNAKDTNQRAQQQIAKDVETKRMQGFVFAPETAVIVYRELDEDGKTVLQNPSQTELARRAYEKKSENASANLKQHKVTDRVL